MTAPNVPGGPGMNALLEDEEVLAFLSHDMRSPQSSIIALLELHELDPDDNPKEEVHKRIEQYARIVGREWVIAGVDCGFGTTAGRATVHHELVWAKLAALAEGAALASARLWR